MTNSAGIEDDPRIQALDAPALEGAGGQIKEYCNIDGLVAAAPSAPPDGGGATVLPDEFPSELVPPGADADAAVTTANGSVDFETVTAIADVIAYHTDVLGPRTREVGASKGAAWMSTYEGMYRDLAVVEMGPGLTRANVTLGADLGGCSNDAIGWRDHSMGALLHRRAPTSAYRAWSRQAKPNSRGTTVTTAAAQMANAGR